jgi:hypothetical protein
MIDVRCGGIIRLLVMVVTLVGYAAARMAEQDGVHRDEYLDDLETMTVLGFRWGKRKLILS